MSSQACWNDFRSSVHNFGVRCPINARAQTALAQAWASKSSVMRNAWSTHADSQSSDGVYASVANASSPIATACNISVFSFKYSDSLHAEWVLTNVIFTDHLSMSSSCQAKTGIEPLLLLAGSAVYASGQVFVSHTVLSKIQAPNLSITSQDVYYLWQCRTVRRKAVWDNINWDPYKISRL